MYENLPTFFRTLVHVTTIFTTKHEARLVQFLEVFWLGQNRDNFLLLS